jgi:hypothetical protein
MYTVVTEGGELADPVEINNAAVQRIIQREQNPSPFVVVFCVLLVIVVVYVVYKIATPHPIFGDYRDNALKSVVIRRTPSGGAMYNQTPVTIDGGAIYMNGLAGVYHDGRIIWESGHLDIKIK